MSMTIVVTALAFVAPTPIEEPMPLLRKAPDYSYRVGTTSAECQAHFDQGLIQLYQHKGEEAARSFETAVQCDPQCALAWWALSRALESDSKDKQSVALK